MPTYHEHQSSLTEHHSPISIFASAITNILSSANSKAELQKWDKFTLSALVSCFPTEKADKFLTKKPLLETLAVFKGHIGRLREAIPKGTRITLVITPCSDNGLPLPISHFNDEKNENFPYFQLLYSNPEDAQELALGLGNIRPAPLLQLFPEEILTQCYIDIDWPDQSFQQESEVDPDEQDYNYLVAALTEKYARLQELIYGQLK